MEIERKYLVKTLPEHLEQYQSKKIAQGYLCTAPVVRIRRSNDDYYLTYKGEGLMVREEYNLPLTKEAYEHLLLKIDGLLIAKTRYLIPLNDHLTAELDIFEKDLAPLSLVEVEFDSIEEADRFTAPDWFGEDVTNSGKYHNSYLSQHSRLANSYCCLVRITYLKSSYLLSRSPSGITVSITTAIVSIILSVMTSLMDVRILYFSSKLSDSRNSMSFGSTSGCVWSGVTAFSAVAFCITGCAVSAFGSAFFPVSSIDSSTRSNRYF